MIRTLILSATMALVLAFAAQASAAPAAPRLDWQPCDPGFECATARVPLDYDHPNGRKIELALIRAPAADPTRRSVRSSFIPAGRAVRARTSSGRHRPR